ncbi:MAG: S8 family serine peptidase [Hyphomicrobiales bacterium]
MRPRLVLLVTLLSLCGLGAGVPSASAAPAAASPRPADVRAAGFTPPAARMSPVLSSAAVTSLSGGQRAALWVFFTDKGIADARAFAREVRAAGDRMTARARARRALETGGRFVPDATDLPVPSSYVDAVRSTGADLRHVSRWLNAASVSADLGEARRIASLPFVRAILPLRASRRTEPVGPVSLLPPAPGSGGGGGSGLEAPAPDRGAGTLRVPGGLTDALAKPGNYGQSITQLSSINVPAAHDSGWSGANVILAMFDTGFNKAHTATVQLKRRAEWDFVFGDSETANQANDVTSAWDHGTGTWSVAGGYWIGNLIGPAYNATFLLAKTEDVRSETPVEEDNWVAAAEWADSIGAAVISSSLAYLDFDGTVNDYTYADLDGYTTVVTLGAVFAQRHGIVVCNANSNNGPSPGTLWAPADADSIVSVGAVDSGNNVASFSSRGPTYDGRIKPEVVAQGVSTTWAVASNNNSIGLANGTSLSTPLVAGCAALVREAHPEWTVEQVREALMQTADSAATPDNDRGWGRIDVVKAIYQSSFGPPVYPKPFDLLVPPTQSAVTALPVTLKWRRSIDPNGDPVSYHVSMHETLTPNDVVFEQTTTDTFTVVTGYLGPSKTYEWNVTASDPMAHARDAREPFRFTTGATTDVAVPPSAPRVVLYQSRPNPAHRAAEIPFLLAGAGSPVPASLRIFDARGRLVRTLFDADASTARYYVIRWDGEDQNGRPVASGIYYYRLTAADREETRRLVLLR